MARPRARNGRSRRVASGVDAVTPAWLDHPIANQQRHHGHGCEGRQPRPLPLGMSIREANTNTIAGRSQLQHDGGEQVRLHHQGRYQKADLQTRPSRSSTDPDPPRSAGEEERSHQEDEADTRTDPLAQLQRPSQPVGLAETTSIGSELAAAPPGARAAPPLPVRSSRCRPGSLPTLRPWRV